MLYFNAADAQNSLDAQHQSLLTVGGGGSDEESRRYAGLPVHVDYRFYVSALTDSTIPPDIAPRLASGISPDLDRALVNSNLFVNLGAAKESTVKHR